MKYAAVFSFSKHDDRPFREDCVGTIVELADNPDITKKNQRFLHMRKFYRGGEAENMATSYIEYMTLSFSDQSNFFYVTWEEP